jgi:hypothetical protein
MSEPVREAVTWHRKLKRAFGSSWSKMDFDNGTASSALSNYMMHFITVPQHPYMQGCAPVQTFTSRRRRMCIW